LQEPEDPELQAQVETAAGEALHSAEIVREQLDQAARQGGDSAAEGLVGLARVEVIGPEEPGGETTVRATAANLGLVDLAGITLRLTWMSSEIQEKVESLGEIQAGSTREVEFAIPAQASSQLLRLDALVDGRVTDTRFISVEAFEPEPEEIATFRTPRLAVLCLPLGLFGLGALAFAGSFLALMILRRRSRDRPL
jgi:hypothetical protein